MDKAALAAEITTDPAGIGYAAKLPGGETGAIAEMLNAKTFTAHRSRMISWRGLYASYGVGATLAQSILGKIRAGAASSQLMYDVEKMIYSTEGIDIGDGASLEMIDQMQAQGVFTQAEADALKLLSIQNVSRAEMLGFVRVTEQDVIEALNV
jgi:urease gamma subunit